MLFLAVSEEDSAGREVAPVILLTGPSVLEQDAEVHNLPWDRLFLLIAKRCPDVGVDGEMETSKGQIHPLFITRRTPQVCLNEGNGRRMTQVKGSTKNEEEKKNPKTTCWYFKQI